MVLNDNDCIFVPSQDSTETQSTQTDFAKPPEHSTAIISSCTHLCNPYLVAD